MREIRILPAVLHDIAEAAAWYDEQKYPGLGDRFLDTFYASLSHIQQDGEIFRAAYQDFRRVLIRPFPYSVYFRLHCNIWIVTLVIHAARKPALARALLRTRKWAERAGAANPHAFGTFVMPPVAQEIMQKASGDT